MLKQDQRSSTCELNQESWFTSSDTAFKAFQNEQWKEIWKNNDDLRSLLSAVPQLWYLWRFHSYTVIIVYCIWNLAEVILLCKYMLLGINVHCALCRQNLTGQQSKMLVQLTNPASCYYLLSQAQGVEFFGFLHNALYLQPGGPVFKFWKRTNSA